MQTRTLDDLRDSRILFDKDPPAFGYFFILVITAALVGLLVMSLRIPKIYMIQAKGTVTNDDANYVMCTYTGEIAESHMREGMIVEKGDILFTVKSTDYDLQEEQLTGNRKTYEKMVGQYELLVRSVKEDENLFDDSDPDDELFYSTYEAYKAQVKQNVIDTTAYYNYGYTEEQIEAELVKNQGKISEIYYNTIKSAENSISEANMQIAAIDAQLASLRTGQDGYAVRATADGVLHLLGDYKSGMVVQTTMTVGTITPQNTESVIEAYVSTYDMARMSEGDEAQIIIDGLSQNVYGTVSGRVTHIDSDVSTREGTEGDSQVFRVLIAMDGNYLINRSGDKVDITNGMTATARISYDKVTYFNYVLEKLGFKVR